MKDSTVKKIVIVTESVLGIVGFIFLCISMFGNAASNYPLDIALGCTGVAGLLNAFYLIKSRKNTK